MTPDAGTSPWWVLVIGAVPSFIGGSFVIWRMWIERGTKRDEYQMTREERLMRDMDVQRAASDKKAADFLDRVQAELLRRDAEAERLRQQALAMDAALSKLRMLVEFWSDVARMWWRTARAERHARKGMHSTINMLREASGQAAFDWTEPDLPPWEEPT